MHNKALFDVSTIVKDGSLVVPGGLNEGEARKILEHSVAYAIHLLQLSEGQPIMPLSGAVQRQLDTNIRVADRRWRQFSNLADIWGPEDRFLEMRELASDLSQVAGGALSGIILCAMLGAVWGFQAKGQK